MCFSDKSDIFWITFADTGPSGSYKIPHTGDKESLDRCGE